MKKRKVIPIVFLLVITSIAGCGSSASNKTKIDENSIVVEDAGEFVTQEFEFYSDDEHLILYNFPKSYEKDGTDYAIDEDDISYEMLGSRDTVQIAVDTNVEELEEIPDSYTYEGASGKEYELENEQVYVKEQGIVAIPVTEEVFYEDQITKPSVPGKKMITYYDRKSNEDKEIEGFLTSFEETVPGHWSSNLEVSGTFMAPAENCNVYELTGVPNVAVSRSADSPAWPGYESQILKSMGLDDKYFRITSASWNGEQYDQDGYVMRNALFKGDMFVSTYKATYETEREAEGYSTKVFYRADADAVNADAGDITTVYRIKAVVKYRLMK